MSWIYLVVASLFEVAWTYSLKSLSIQKIRTIDWSQFQSHPAGLMPLVPLIGYIAFGVGNVVFLSMAMRQIPTATAYATWMALAVVGLRIIDSVVLKQPFSLMHLFYTSLIIAGVLGLRRLE
ncbi:DMT family transporter [Hymenobacter terrenus]|uniref:DMT family transporter n=1 Tax=Hymenobacter terrenus TaxID=1629124 RepID=UPI00061A0255|nr:SMR family transporter [Hymenobacter terrenus]